MKKEDDRKITKKKGAVMAPQIRSKVKLLISNTQLRSSDNYFSINLI